MGKLRMWLDDAQFWFSSIDGKLVGALAAGAVLLAGGFFAAKNLTSRAAAAGDSQKIVRLVTTVPVTVRDHGRKVVRYRRKIVYAQASTTLETQTIRTPEGTRVVTRPVTRYHVVYRKKVVTRNGHARTVLQPVTSTQSLASTDLVTTTATRTATVTQTQPVTVTQPVTDTQVVTTTVVTTETDTLPVTVTVTVTLPGT